MKVNVAQIRSSGTGCRFRGSEFGFRAQILKVEDRGQHTHKGKKEVQNQQRQKGVLEEQTGRSERCKIKQTNAGTK